MKRNNMTNSLCTIAYNLGAMSVFDFCVAPLWIICHILRESHTQNVAPLTQLNGQVLDTHVPRATMDPSTRIGV